MNRYKIGLNMYLILLIIKYIIYNEFVFVISFFILCDLCYGCNFFFGVVICWDFYEVCLLYSVGKKNFNLYLREKESWKIKEEIINRGWFIKSSIYLFYFVFILVYSLYVFLF